jgi:hypothetical protein
MSLARQHSLACQPPALMPSQAKPEPAVPPALRPI